MSNEPTKVCSGPAHHGPALLPLTERHWQFYRSGARAGRPLSRCKLCRHWNVLVQKDGPHGLVEAKSVVPLAVELLDRCGSAYRVEQSHGVNEATLRAIVDGRTQLVRKRTAQQIILGLSEQRKYDRRNGASARFMEARRRQAIIEERLEREVCR